MCKESLKLTRGALATAVCWHGGGVTAVFVLQGKRNMCMHCTQVSCSGVTWSGANEARAVGVVSFKVMQKCGGRVFSEDLH